jgi:hypothetical protein
MQKEIRKLIKEIPGSEIKNYIKSVKSCRGGNTYELEAKFGVLALQFSDLDVDEAIISFRRKSGNGLVIAVSGPHLKDVQISSKVNQQVGISLDSSKVLNIKRPFRSRGSVEVKSIALWNNHFMMEVDWSSVLKKCHEHTCLRLVDGKLMASEGAMIAADAISNVVTQPANMFTLSEGTVVFLGSCEIRDITVDGVGTDIPKENYMRHHLEKEPPVLIPEPSKDSGAVQPTERPVRKIPEETRGHSSRLLYDSQNMGFNSSFGNSGVRVSDNHIVLGGRGEYKIPARFVNINSNYVLVVEAANLRGNGKMSVEIAPGTVVSDSNTILVTQQKKAYNKTVRSSSDNSCLHNVVIGRHLSATGDISVSRVMVLADFDRSYQIPENLRFNQLPSGAPMPYQALFHDSMLHVSRVVDDDVLINSRRYARHRSLHNPPRIVSHRATIRVHTASGMSWLSKAQPLVPGLEPTDKPGADLCIGTAGALSEAARIYLEEFKPDELSEADIKKLSKAKKVMSPSSGNVEWLTGILPEGIEISHVPRLWPYVEPKKLVPVSDYMVTFNRDPKVTSYLIDSLNGLVPNLVVLGARGKYPSWVVPVNEYLGYHNLMHVLCNARCVVDVPPVYDYTSAALHLVQAAGIPVVSSNWMCMEAKGSHFVIADQDHDGKRVPSKEALSTAVKEAVETSVKSVLDEGYNETFAKNIDRLFV